ncbi:hypothetical protein SDC9_162265 [bioreactor metagenome]|uniref:Uncharacterized protein n=1 Tax=bioreactor metagenome TaxID=1076179 RepID=A0A645FMP5_9ZZZZ
MRKGILDNQKLLIRGIFVGHLDKAMVAIEENGVHVHFLKMIGKEETVVRFNFIGGIVMDLHVDGIQGWILP